MAARLVISTHWFRRTARTAKRKYERIQGTSGDILAHPAEQHLAELQLRSLGINTESQLYVQRCASAARGRWEVCSK